MLQPRIPKALTTTTASPLEQLASTLNALSLCPRHNTFSRSFTTTSSRPASHAAQGRANGPKDSAGRRLGSKKGASEYVIPGNIIFKQRGTLWFPGENVGMGKDHTIYATQPGWVRYYRNPFLHPKRRYIGVALEKEGPKSQLPTKPWEERRRRLGMYATPIKEVEMEEMADHDTFLEEHLADSSVPKSKGQANVMSQRGLGRWTPMHELVEEAEKNQVKVRPWKKTDRFYAWRVRTAKFEAKKILRAATGKVRKGKSKAKARK